MVERSFQARNDERRISKATVLSNAVHRAREFRARRLEFKDELLQIFVLVFFQAELVRLLPELHRALEAAMLERMPEIAVLRANPVNAFAVRFRFGRRLGQRILARAIHFLDPLVFFLGLLRSQLAQPTISFAIFSSASGESPYFS